jgi:hypothetical protein
MRPNEKLIKIADDIVATANAEYAGDQEATEALVDAYASAEGLSALEKAVVETLVFARS